MCGTRAAGRDVALASAPQSSERMMAVMLGAGSYLFILYGSEARGYALAMAAAVIAFEVAERWRTNQRQAYTRLFFGCVVVGLLAHATFSFVYAALLGSMLARTSDRRAVLAFHRWPLLAVIVYACSILRLMQVGGGNLMPWRKIAVQFATYGFGHWLLAAVFVVLGFLELRRASEYRMFFVLLLVLPVLAATRAEYLHVRYFVIMLPFLLALAARALGSCRLRTGGDPLWLRFSWSAISERRPAPPPNCSGTAEADIVTLANL
jgi:hypothetical protein